MDFLTHNLQLPVFTSKQSITVSPTINTSPFLLRHCMYFFKFNTAESKVPFLALHMQSKMNVGTEEQDEG
jgi:hypothetical protein